MADNLIPQSKRTKAEQREIARAGGIASGKARREKKALRETLEELLAMPIKTGKKDDLEKIKCIANMKGKNITMQETIMLAMLNKAAKGDVRAAEYIRDTIGQKPGLDIAFDDFEDDGLMDALREGAKVWDEE